ncbi:MAG: hypothetical protein AMXMBFR57_35860 [Acidimicrobiia bacterium]
MGVRLPSWLRSRWAWIAAAASLAIVASLWAFWRQSPAEAGTVPVAVEATDLQRAALEYDAAEREARAAQQDVAKGVTEYVRRTRNSPIELPADGDLTEPQRALLQQAVAREGGAVKALLTDLLVRDAQLQEARRTAQSLRARLPTSVVAVEGDRHDRIAIDFLVSRGLERAEAYGLVSQVNLQSTLLPGFRVWLLHEDGRFGTWVTQGDADMSPQALAEKVESMLAAERSLRESEVGALKDEVTNLRDLSEVARRADEQLLALQQEAAVAYRTAETLQAKADTIYYVVGRKADLVQANVIDKNLFLRLEQGGTALKMVPGASVAVDGTVHNMTRIRKVQLSPLSFRNGIDYVVELEGNAARVRFQNVQRFKNLGRVLAIVLE